MAPPIVANTNFQQWQNWRPVQEPGGATTYYVIPGYNDQYVFDPYTSNATGEITIYRNPEPVYAEAQRQRREQEKKSGLAAQLAVPAGAIAGSLGVDYVSDLIRDAGKEVVKEGTKEGASQAFQSGLTGGSGTGGGAGYGGAVGLGQGAPPAYGASIADAAQYYGPEIAARPDLLAQSTSTTVADAARAAGTEAYRQPSLEQGFASGLGPVAQGALGAAGLAIGGKGVYDAYKARDPLAGGISGAGAGLGASALTGALAPTLGLAAIPGVGWFAAGGALLGASLGLFGDRPSTKEIQEKRRQRLLQADPSIGQVYQGITKPIEQSFAETQAAREQFPEGFVGWDESGQVFVNRAFEESGDPSDLTAWDVAGTIDNFETFGSNWITGLSEKQRLAIMNKAIRDGKVDPEKGALEVNYDDDLLQFANKQFQAFAEGNADPTDPSLLAGVPARPRPLDENTELQHLNEVQREEVKEEPKDKITDMAAVVRTPQTANVVGQLPGNSKIDFDELSSQLAVMMDNRQQLGAGRPVSIGEIKKQRRG